MKLANPISALLLVLMVLSGCSSPAGPQGDISSQLPPSTISRTLVIAIRVEPDSIATRRLGQLGVSITGLKAMFNALIAYIDESGVAHPNIVESLPVLNSDSWRVFPDGRMETTYRLKGGLRWHDGTAASPDDFRLSWQVHTKPDYGLASAIPFQSMEEVVAIDERTVVIRWKASYPDAGVLSATNDEFPILPAHLLRAHFEQLDAEAFANLPFWNREYIGLGPYRIDRWDAGSFLEGAAFDAYSLGRPKIARIRVVFIPDLNTTLANLLAGQVDIASENTLGLAQVDIIRREAADRLALLPARGGAWRATLFQLRPEYVSPRALLDHRLREALARTVDKDAINETVYLGTLAPADFMVHPNSRFGPAAERGTVKYPLDPRRSEQLMNDAGFSRGGDGFYAGAVDGRFTVTLKSTQSVDTAAFTAMASSWRQLGFDVQESFIPAAEGLNAEVANTFPGMFTRATFSNLTTLVAFTTAGIGRPENRWTGTNRGGWSNADYDRLAGAFTTTLDAQARADQVTQMARILTEDLPFVSLFFTGQPIPYPVGLSGLRSTSDESNYAFSVQEWEFR